MILMKYHYLSNGFLLTLLDGNPTYKFMFLQS